MPGLGCDPPRALEASRKVGGDCFGLRAVPQRRAGLGGQVRGHKKTDAARRTISNFRNDNMVGTIGKLTVSLSDF
jgi:hypothetical protein